MKPYFKELAVIKPNDILYAVWIKHMLSLSNEDIKNIIQMGLTHQAYALKSMVNELIANEDAPAVLIEKVDAVVSAANQHADKIRST